MKNFTSVLITKEYKGCSDFISFCLFDFKMHSFNLLSIFVVRLIGLDIGPK